MGANARFDKPFFAVHSCIANLRSHLSLQLSNIFQPILNRLPKSPIPVSFQRALSFVFARNVLLAFFHFYTDVNVTVNRW